MLSLMFAVASVGFLLLAKRLRGAESRVAPQANTDNLSFGARITLGVICAAIGCAVIAGAAIHTTDPFVSERFFAVPAGLMFVFGGALVTLPPGSARWESLLEALLVTCFALTIDWVAFGPGERRFGGGMSFGPVGTGFGVGEMYGRAAFGVVAIVLDIFAIVVWSRQLRRRERLR